MLKNIQGMKVSRLGRREGVGAPFLGVHCLACQPAGSIKDERVVRLAAAVLRNVTGQSIIAV